ncbi:MAG TPA: hypothetical protein VIZ19_09280, partial [Roseiarcus sp.]
LARRRVPDAIPCLMVTKILVRLELEFVKLRRLLRVGSQSQDKGKTRRDFEKGKAHGVRVGYAGDPLVSLHPVDSSSFLQPCRARAETFRDIFIYEFQNLCYSAAFPVGASSARKES